MSTALPAPCSEERLRNLDQSYQHFNSTSSKALSAIPIFGHIPYYIFQSQIYGEIRGLAENMHPSLLPKFIEFIEVKNDHKRWHTVGRMFEIALLIVGIVNGFIPSVFAGLCFITACLAFMIGNVLDIDFNNRVITHLQEDGIHHNDTMRLR